MQNDPALLGKEKIGKLLFHYSFPAIVGMVVMATYNIVDTIFVGMLGSEAIAALSIAFPLQMLLGAVGIGTGIGAASLISRSLGAGDVREAERAAGQVITLALVFGLLTALLGSLYLRPLLGFVGTRPELMSLTEEYLQVITSGSVMFFLIMIMNNLLRAVGNPLLSMKIMIISALTNIALDPIFIFLLEMGVRGAAVATVISKVFGVAIMCYYFFAGKSPLQITLANLRPRLTTIMNVYRIGFPAMIMQLSINISLIIANYILAGHGHIPVAVMGIIFRLKMFAVMPVIGISQGLLPIIGYNYGAGNLVRIREALLKGAGISTLIITAASAVLMLYPTFFLSLFSSEKELLTMGKYALRIMFIMFPLIGAQFVSTVFFQATGKGIPSLFLSILREVIFFIPFILLLSSLYGLEGVWLARPASDLLAFLVTMLLISRELKQLGIRSS